MDKAGAAVEFAAERQQDQHGNAQRDHAFDVKRVDHGHHHAHRHGPQRQPVGPKAAACDTQRQHDQNRTKDTGHQRSTFQQDQREHPLQRVARFGGRGDQRGEGHPQSRAEDHDRKHHRCHRADRPQRWCHLRHAPPQPEQRLPARGAAHHHQRLVKRKHHKGQNKGHHEIDDPEHQQGGSRRFNGNGIGQRRKHDHLEHADPARDVADDAGHGCGGENAQKGAEPDVADRQQQIQRQRRKGDVTQAEQRLSQQNRQRRCPDGEAPKAQAALARARHHKRQGQRKDQPDGQPAHFRRRKGRKRPQQIRVEGKCPKPYDRGCNAVGHSGKGGHRRHVIGIQPLPRINPVAHSTTRHGAQPDGVAKSIGHQPAGQGDGQWQRLADIAQGRPVIADQKQIPRQSCQMGQHQDRDGRAAHLCDHIRQLHIGQKVQDRIKAQCKQGHGQGIGENGTCHLPSAGGLVR